jgi:tRNA-2-methylthio-N6-dimethylallyladenosine synthase
MVAQIEGDFIIRFMTSHPKDASEKLINAIAKYSPKIAPFFHLPIQSGSDRVLSLMNRRYTVEKYLDTVDKIKKKIPGIALSTDIIVGFPSESEEDFQKTLEVLKKVEYDLVYAFIYSQRVGTKAALLPDDLSRKEKSERLTRLLKLQDEISIRKNNSYINNTVRVLVESEEIRDRKRILTGKTDTMKTVHFESDSGRIGEFINVIIKKSFVSHLEGEERG